MRRIVLMVARLFLKAPYYLLRILWFSKSSKKTYEESFFYIKKVTKAANKAGRVKIESYGLENIPKEEGFIFFPNHQGMFDVLVFLDSSPVPFAFVMKKEVRNTILLKQVADALGSLSIDREDIRQSMTVIQTMAEEVKKGKNFLIFPEGTRSKKGNRLIDFKGGSFKSAVKARCPIVPCALIDSFKPFDEKTIRPVTVKLFYLPPLYYEEYKGLKTVEIAETVKKRIETAITEYEDELHKKVIDK
mgnify:CR=1 FL=1